MRHRALIFLGLLSAAASPATQRHELSLNGEWACSVQPGKAGKATVPGYLSGVDDEVATFSREFAVPEAMKGQRLKLRFGGVKYNSTILVNGKQVASHFGGYEPFEADVTDTVRLDKPNQLIVRCYTWAGVMTDGPKQFSKAGGWDQVRGAPRDRILAPIGGLYGLYGIWDDVTLVSHPAVYIKDLFIKPSVRRNELVVDYTLANESGADAEVELSAAIVGAITLPKATLNVPAGKTATATLKAPWPKSHLWSHADPFLYVLKSEIGNRKSEISDALASRFGFREFWCQGPDFYLNGSKIHLLASSGWPPHGPQTRDQIAAFWKGLKACGCVAFRTHTQPWPAAYYDVADELGLLIIPEGAVWNDDDVYRVNDPAFWDNYAAHLTAMVGSLKNHPSVVMWSLENEFTGGRVNDNTPYPKEQLIRLGKLVKQLDPTRPIMYESDGDPGGVADVIGIHYPHEYPDYTCWPNEGYWLDKPSPGSGGGGIFLNGEKAFLWKRDKPLYIGEFLWVPSSDPAPHTIFFGDDAYRDYHHYRNLAKAECWKMQILAYRVQGVSGICPWTVTEGGPLDDTNALWRAHKWAYQPIAAYCLDYDTRFYSGEKVHRRVVVFNDILERSDLLLKWALRQAAKTIDKGEEMVSLAPAEKKIVDVNLRMPKWDTLGMPYAVWPEQHGAKVEWDLTLERNGQRVFAESHDYDVFEDRFPIMMGDCVGLYDPQGTTGWGFAIYPNRTKHIRVTSLAHIDPKIEWLVIAARAFKAEKSGVPAVGQVAPERAALAAYLAIGGCVLVLEQDVYPPGLFDFSLTSHCSTMTFPVRRSLLKHLDPSDLRFWRGDNLVTVNEPPRPAKGGYIPLIASGSASGLDHAPLMERRVGKGRLVLCQLRMIGKSPLPAGPAGAEPIVMQLLRGPLGLLDTPKPASQAMPLRTAVLGSTREFADYLRSLDLRFDTPPAEGDLSKYSLVICRGEVGDAAKLRKYVEGGGNVALHRVTPQAFAAVKKEFGLELHLQPYSGIVSKADSDDPLSDVILRQDLYWLGEHRGISWAETPRAGNMADSVLGLSLDPAKAKSFEVDGWALQGGLVERRQDHVVFATVGTATGEVEFPEDGLYVFGVVGRGTPCRGDYPIASVAVDGRPVGAVSVDSPQTCTRTTFGEVAKGRHKVSVAFTNDATDAAKGEDRNLVVDKLLIARSSFPLPSGEGRVRGEGGGAVPDSRGPHPSPLPKGEGVKAKGEGERREAPLPRVCFLTSPPAVAAVRVGKGLVVIDQLRWDTEERNARKAARYASTLLAALGGDFADRPSWAIECETMTPQPDMGWFHADGSAAHFGCNGWIKTPIEVAAAGRYTMEVVAGGTAAQGVYPHVEVRIDGKKAVKVQLTSGGLRPYPVAIELPAGKHELSLAFTNDLNVGGEDRNLTLDKVVFYRE